MSPTTLDARAYWETRLSDRPNLRGTGHRAFSLDYNNLLYQAQLDCLRLVLARHAVTVRGRSVLDVGSGTGFYIRYYVEQGARPVTGLDITEVSVRYLQNAYPQQCFVTGDIAAPHLPVSPAFHLISAISVLYHILDDALFERALANLCEHLHPDGYLVLSDTFAKSVLPTARHAKYRSLATYRTVLDRYHVKMVELAPIYYLMNRVFVPVVGPFVIDRLGMGALFYRTDQRLRRLGMPNGSAMKLLLARRAT